MRWWKILLIVFAGLYGLWLLLFPSYTHRFRLTAEIEVDGVVHSGSSVIEVTWRSNGPVAPLLGGTQWEASVRGQAALVDLGPKGIVLVCLSSAPFPEVPFTGSAFFAFQAFAGKVPQIDKRYAKGISPIEETHLAALSGLKGRVALPSLPAIVWLKDKNDPRTYILINRPKTADEMGPNTKVLGVSIEMTASPVTAELFTQLPWLKTQLAAKLDEQSSRSGVFNFRPMHLTQGLSP